MTINSPQFPWALKEHLNLSEFQLMRKLIQAVLKGGEAIMPFYHRGHFDIYTKSGDPVADEAARRQSSQNLVTEADLASHKAIAGVMGELDYKGIPLVYEESNFKEVSQGEFIAFDEMDGTGPFIRRKPGFMVLGQYVKHFDPLLSAGVDPVKNLTYVAAHGRGSFINGRPVKTRQNTTLDQARVIVPERAEMMPEFKPFLQAMTAYFRERLRIGLATGSRIGAILSDEVDCFVNSGSEELRVWDLAMVLNLREAGGVATRKDGSPIYFDHRITQDIVCSSNERLHEAMLRKLEAISE